LFIAGRGDIQNLTLLSYTKLSSVKYEVDVPDKRYVVFVPPNLDSNCWELDSIESLNNGYYAVFPAKLKSIVYSV